jgi:hypothetical protein
MHAKLFAAGLVLVVGCGTPTLLRDVHQADVRQAQQEAAARSADQLTLAHELPDTPPDVEATLVHLVADGSPTGAAEACLLFTAAAAQQFAVTNGQHTCLAAMRQLHNQVSDPDTYANDLTVPASAWTQVGGTATVNGCAATWSDLFTETPLRPPGPRPGLMILNRLDGYGWQITSYEPC